MFYNVDFSFIGKIYATIAMVYMPLHIAVTIFNNKK